MWDPDKPSSQPSQTVGNLTWHQSTRFPLKETILIINLGITL